MPFQFHLLTLLRLMEVSVGNSLSSLSISSQLKWNRLFPLRFQRETWKIFSQYYFYLNHFCKDSIPVKNMISVLCILLWLLQECNRSHTQPIICNFVMSWCKNISIFHGLFSYWKVNIQISDDDEKLPLIGLPGQFC